MWEQFCDLGKYEANVIDTTNQTVPETIESIKAHLKSGQNRIKKGGIRSMKQRTYIAIDLKSFYASVECREKT